MCHKTNQSYLEWDANDDLDTIIWDFELYRDRNTEPKTPKTIFDWRSLDEYKSPLERTVDEVDDMTKKFGQHMLAIALLEEERGRYL